MKQMKVHNEISDSSLILGLVEASGVTVRESPESLRDQIRALIERRRDEDFPPQMIKEGIRALIRRGGFKPSGRSKPSSEFLAQAAREGRFPWINNLVDINNFLSLDSGLPVSLLDLDVVGDAVTLRYGRSGERYIFNASGQSIELEGLISVCAGAGPSEVPIGNPVKDSMAGKIKVQTRAVLGVVYACKQVLARDEMLQIVERFGKLLQVFGGASSYETSVVGGTPGHGLDDGCGHVKE